MTGPSHRDIILDQFSRRAVPFSDGEFSLVTSRFAFHLAYEEKHGSIPAL